MQSPCFTPPNFPSLLFCDRLLCPLSPSFLYQALFYLFIFWRIVGFPSLKSALPDLILSAFHYSKGDDYSLLCTARFFFFPFYLFVLFRLSCATVAAYSVLSCPAQSYFIPSAPSLASGSPPIQTALTCTSAILHVFLFLNDLETFKWFRISQVCTALNFCHNTFHYAYNNFH
jgi:hypothetical protein